MPIGLGGEDAPNGAARARQPNHIQCQVLGVAAPVLTRICDGIFAASPVLPVLDVALRAPKDCEEKMKNLTVTLMVSALGLAFVLASPAEAAKTSKHKKPAATQPAKQNHATVATRSGFQGGVLAGPLYNGQDYLGTDPDPNIRAFMLKDLGSRYGGAF
jgi:hypothetical protein